MSLNFDNNLIGDRYVSNFAREYAKKEDEEKRSARALVMAFHEEHKLGLKMDDQSNPL
jgi:hypothetical protein